MYISSNPSLPFGALFGRRLGNGSESYSGPSDSRLYEYSRAREAVADFLSAAGITAGDSILLPAYICSSVLDPFLKLGIRILFYPIDRTLSPNVEAVRELLSQKPRAIFLVHYFGFPAGTGDLIQECRENGLWIVEDCAHTLPVPDGSGIGSAGDLTIYSLSKLLPVPDGALVVVNNPKLEWPETPTAVNKRLVFINMLWQAANSVEVSSGFSFRTRLRDKRAATRMITGLRESSSGSKPAPVNGSRSRYQRFQMSPLANRIRSRIDLASVARQRRENYQVLKSAMKSVRGATPVFGDLDPAGAPLGFPILVDDREAVRLKLIAAGVDPRPVWSGLPREVPSAGFEDARYIAAHNIVLPVHQNLTPKTLSYIVSALERAIATSQ